MLDTLIGKAPWKRDTFKLNCLHAGLFSSVNFCSFVDIKKIFQEQCNFSQNSLDA